MNSPTNILVLPKEIISKILVEVCGLKNPFIYTAWDRKKQTCSPANVHLVCKRFHDSCGDSFWREIYERNSDLIRSSRYVSDLKEGLPGVTIPPSRIYFSEFTKLSPKQRYMVQMAMGYLDNQSGTLVLKKSYSISWCILQSLILLENIALDIIRVKRYHLYFDFTNFSPDRNLLELIHKVSSLRSQNGIISMRKLTIQNVRLDEIRDLVLPECVASLELRVDHVNANGKSKYMIVQNNNWKPPSLQHLTSFAMVNYNLSDISFLSEYTSLRKLVLSDNAIVDAEPLRDLAELVKLDLSDNKITDISPISDLTNLEYLYIQYNQITDIYCLSELSNLDNCAFHNNCYLPKNLRRFDNNNS